MRKNPHRLSNTQLTTFDLGELVPVGYQEVLPGDIFRHSSSLFARLSPLAAPVMHELDVRVHHFYTPWRIVWEDAGGTGTWEDFITGGNSGNDAQSVPTLNSTGTAGDLLDYLGIPPVSGVAISGLPIAAFNAIFNEWYRDQDLVTERVWNDLTIPKVAWGKDYLTAARAWPQRGDSVALPLGSRADVKGLMASSQTYAANSASLYETPDTTHGIGTIQTTSTSGSAFSVREGQSGFPDVYADLTNATAATVSDLRLAFALQRFAELRARFGARYPEYLARYGIRNQDGRLQLPEFLGGGSSRVQFSEVLQTAPESTGRDYSVGDLYGHGIAAMRSNAYVRQFPEWGCVLSLVSMRPKAMYMDGIHRSFLRQDREDFWDPTLEGVGDQAVWKNEVYADAVDGDDVWAYQGRYDDYRYGCSGVQGEFRSTLDYWHLGRTFATDPALNSTFVTCDPSKRIFNEQTAHSVWLRVRHNINALRPVSAVATTRTL